MYLWREQTQGDSVFGNCLQTWLIAASNPWRILAGVIFSSIVWLRRAMWRILLRCLHGNIDVTLNPQQAHVRSVTSQVEMKIVVPLFVSFFVLLRPQLLTGIGNRVPILISFTRALQRTLSLYLLVSPQTRKVFSGHAMPCPPSVLLHCCRDRCLWSANALCGLCCSRISYIEYLRDSMKKSRCAKEKHKGLLFFRKQKAHNQALNDPTLSACRARSMYTKAWPSACKA